MNNGFSHTFRDTFYSLTHTSKRVIFPYFLSLLGDYFSGDQKMISFQSRNKHGHKTPAQFSNLLKLNYFNKKFQHRWLKRSHLHACSLALKKSLTLWRSDQKNVIWSRSAFLKK